MSPYNSIFMLLEVAVFSLSPAAGGQFQPTCGAISCPSITWTDAIPGQATTFTLRSSSRMDATNNWVSFGFASAQTMTSTLVVVDCYDLNGNLSTGTSKNLAGDNVDYPADLSKVTARMITFKQGVYTCTFNMTLPNATVYAIVAEGKMDPTSAASPKKLYHGPSKYWSNSAFTFAAATVEPQQPANTSLFAPACGAASCPSVTWTNAPAGQTTTFIVTSSRRSDSTNNWVSFGFASMQTMTSTLIVVDCYDLNGNLSTGTSKNLAGDNVDYPADLPKVTARMITLKQGVYTCTFNMTLPNTTVYAIVAEGKMDPTSAASPKKLYHGPSKYWSNVAFAFGTVAAVPRSPAAAGLFAPACGAASCPSVTWANAPAGQATAFIVTSSRRADSANNWVSFGFASMQTMTSTLIVVDCYDLNGNLSTGTSKNLAGDNVDYPADLPKVTARMITFKQGMYTCTFNMTLPNATVYAIVAEGKMNVTSTSAPKKLYHGNSRYWSESAFTFGAAAIQQSSTPVPSPGVTRGGLTTAWRSGYAPTGACGPLIIVTATASILAASLRLLIDS